jgi:hypothetical protein
VWQHIFCSTILSSHVKKIVQCFAGGGDIFSEREKNLLQLAVKFTAFGQEPYHHPSRKLPLPRANRSHRLSLYIAGDICCCDIVYACMLFRFSITSLSMVSWCLFSWVSGDDALSGKYFFRGNHFGFNALVVLF